MSISAPQKSKIQLGIDALLQGQGNSLLLAELPVLELLWEKLSECENDYRTGEETYGYEPDEANMLIVEYISDRWLAAFRIKWLIDGLKNGKIK